MDYQQIAPNESLDEILYKYGYDYLFDRKELTAFSTRIGNFAGNFCKDKSAEGPFYPVKSLEGIRAEMDQLTDDDLRKLFYSCYDVSHRAAYQDMYKEDYCKEEGFKIAIGKAIRARIPYSYAKHVLKLDCGPSRIYHAVAEKVWNGEKIEKDMLAGLPLKDKSILDKLYL